MAFTKKEPCIYTGSKAKRCAEELKTGVTSKSKTIIRPSKDNLKDPKFRLAMNQGFCQGYLEGNTDHAAKYKNTKETLTDDQILSLYQRYKA